MTHRLDGKFSKQTTKDCCEECPHYKRFYEHRFEPGRDKSHPCYMSGDEIAIDEKIEEERCYVGVAWKRLIRVDNPKHCQYFRKEDIKNTKQDDNHVNRNSRQAKLWKEHFL